MTITLHTINGTTETLPGGSLDTRPSEAAAVAVQVALGPIWRPVVRVAPLLGSPRPRCVVTGAPHVLSMIVRRLENRRFFSAYDQLCPEAPAGQANAVYEMLPPVDD